VPPVITVRREADGLRYARSEGHKYAFGCGETPAEAVGQLVFALAGQPGFPRLAVVAEGGAPCRN
jgi:hypothetical protein